MLRAVRETVVPLVEAVSNKTTLFCHWGLLDGLLMQGGFGKDEVGYEGTSE
jgi:hypothetical protein